MSTEPYTTEEKILSDVCVASMTMDRVIFGRFLAKIKADALRSFADELEAQEKLSVDDALTVGVLRERADEIEGEA